MGECSHLPPAVIVPIRILGIKCFEKGTLAGAVFDLDIHNIQPDVPFTEWTILKAAI